MNRKFIALGAILALVAGTAVAQDLKIDYQVNVAAADSANYFTFAGPIRYMASTKDTLDAATGASKFQSTHTFMPYLYDVKGKAALPTGLRGLFLFAVAPKDQREVDNLTVTKSGGTITVQYCHRGTAYKLVTDSKGQFSFPKGDFSRRAVGYIKGAGPQVIASEFSRDGTAAKIDWRKVWDTKIPAGLEIQKGVPNKTGAIDDDNGVSEAMFKWEGTLQVGFDKNILTISGGLNAVKN